MMLVDEWTTAYGRNATGGHDWTYRCHIDAPIESVAEAMLRVRPGRVGPDNAPMINNAFWRRLVLTGGPDRFVGEFGPEATVLVDLDRIALTLAMQGRMGWRIVTQLEPSGHGTDVVRRVEHVSCIERRLTPLLQKTTFGLRGDVRRLRGALRSTRDHHA
jgi:hypothetical protein